MLGELGEWLHRWPPWSFGFWVLQFSQQLAARIVDFSLNKLVTKIFSILIMPSEYIPRTTH
jgi:hypothetical protein